MQKMDRRRVLQGLSVTGVGGALLAFQNCAGAKFGSSENSSASAACAPQNSIFSAPAKAATFSGNKANGLPIDALAATPTAVELEHQLNPAFYSVTHYDQTSTSSGTLTQYLLTLDVGSNPSTGAFHPLESSNSTQLNFITDLYVVRNDTQEIVYWRKLSTADQTPSAMIMLDPALVSAKVQLTVACYCLEHGWFSQMVDLSQTPLPYAGAVGSYQSGVAFGGVQLRRPYVSFDATGGQGNLGILHAPTFTVTSDSVVQVVLGQEGQNHAQFATNHYVAGGALFDQNGNLISLPAEQVYSAASSNNLIFNVGSLKGRNVKSLRVVAFDTFNGLLMGFYSVA